MWPRAERGRGPRIRTSSPPRSGTIVPAWLGSEFSNANFRVRIIDVSDRTTKDVRLDGLAVQVTYTP
jgi:hypothetical protein